jgi:hypothetical protein
VFAVVYKNQDHLLPPNSYLFGIFRETEIIVYRPVHAVRTWIMNIEETVSALENITSGEREYHPNSGKHGDCHGCSGAESIVFCWEA